MTETTYKKQLKKYCKEADNYFSKIGICPDGDEIVSYVADCVEDESGCDVDDSGYRFIAKTLGITVD